MYLFKFLNIQTFPKIATFHEHLPFHKILQLFAIFEHLCEVSKFQIILQLHQFLKF